MTAVELFWFVAGGWSLFWGLYWGLGGKWPFVR